MTAASGEGVGLLQHDPHLHQAKGPDPGLQRARHPPRHQPVPRDVLQPDTQGDRTCGICVSIVADVSSAMIDESVRDALVVRQCFQSSTKTSVHVNVGIDFLGVVSSILALLFSIRRPACGGFYIYPCTTPAFVFWNVCTRS